jgi:hypothetical protein
VTETVRRALVVVTLGLFAWGCGASDKAGGGGAGAGAGSGGAGSTGGAGSLGGAGIGGGAGGGSAGATLTGGAGSTAGAGGGAAPDGGTSNDGGAADGAGSVGDGAPGTAPLTQFLRIIQVTTVQGTTTVSISIDGQKNHSGAIHAGQALTMRIHVRPDTGWVAHPTVAELHLIDAAMDVTLSATRTITGASSAVDLNSTFNFELTAAQVTTDLKFQVALRDPGGTPADPPPAIQRALYPRDGTLDTLDAK